MNTTETQRQRILALLKERQNCWVPLYHILELQPRISQQNARIWELRREGHTIKNYTQTDDNGVRHSWYMLVVEPKQLQLIA